jgi:DNA-binding protein Fis
LHDEQSQPSPDEVKIRLKHRDWEVEITCLESKVKQVVENVLSGIDKSYTNIDPTLNNRLNEVRKEIDSLKLQINSDNNNQRHAINMIELQRQTIPKGGTTCRGLLEILLQEGYFGTEKHLGEVHEELSRRGYNYDRTAVSHSLTDMVRESILTRLGTMRNYQYIQKRPPSESSL